MNHDSITRKIEQLTPKERHQYYAFAQRKIKLMPESLRLRRKASLIPESEEENGNRNDRNRCI